MKDLPNEALVRLLSLIPDNPAKALEKILPEICMAEITKVAYPTAAQLQKLRSLDPYTGLGLADLKKKLSAGSIRFGPQHRLILNEMIVPQLASVKLEATIRQATRDELKAAKLVDDHEPEYFRYPPGPGQV